MDYRQEAKKLKEGGCRTFWFGPAPDAEVDRLGQLLGVSLPEPFRAFLASVGGGGVEGVEIAGIDGAADTEGFGTVYGDTLRLRDGFGIAPTLVVVRVDSEEFAWCLDCSPAGAGRVVGVVLGAEGAPSTEAGTFEDYFREYVEDQLTIAAQ